VGSLALTDGDRWSDLDLTFSVADGFPVPDVLEDWTRDLVATFGAVHLFDVWSGASLYRVFLLPGLLQFDLSFAPAAKFGARGPKFRMLFGQSADLPHAQPPSAHELFGSAVHHALRARFCIERGRSGQAEYWISSTRDCALALACRRHGLPADHGRGLDELPVAVWNRFEGTLVTSLDRAELLRALGRVIDVLLEQADEVQDLAAKVTGSLQELKEAREFREPPAAFDPQRGPTGASAAE
jgi:hypothetical protein